MSESFESRLAAKEGPAPDLNWKEIWIETGRAEERRVSQARMRKQRMLLGSVASLSSIAALFFFGAWMINNRSLPSSAGSSTSIAEHSNSSRASDGNSIEVASQENGSTTTDSSSAKPINDRDSGQVASTNRSPFRESESDVVMAIDRVMFTRWSTPDWIRRKQNLEKAAVGRYGVIQNFVVPNSSLKPLNEDPIIRRLETEPAGKGQINPKPFNLQSL